MPRRKILKPTEYMQKPARRAHDRVIENIAYHSPDRLYDTQTAPNTCETEGAARVGRSNPHKNRMDLPLTKRIVDSSGAGTLCGTPGRRWDDLNKRDAGPFGRREIRGNAFCDRQSRWRE
jgi:hypothetical protein